MNTNRDVLSGSNLSMPSGSEVEAATFHTPVTSGMSSPVTPMHSSSGMKEKLDTLKSQGLSRLHHIQHVVSDRSSEMRSSLQRSVTNASTLARIRVNDSMTKMQSSMAASPMKWAGIAAGSGFALGLMGRFIHWRNKKSMSMPQLVVIEAAC